MRLKEIQRRILEVLNILYDEKRRKGMASGVAMPFFLGRLKEANRPLLAELGILNKREQFLSGRKEFRIVLFVGVGSIVISSLVAFGVPWYQSISRRHADIQAVYKNVITNQDIFISNMNNVRSLEGTSTVSTIPESFIESDVSDDTRKIIQENFGLIQYRFFLYYLQQTSLLNEEMDHLRTYFIATGPESSGFSSAKKVYLDTMRYLSGEELEVTRFNYQEDTECLQYFFERNFSYLNIDGRGEAPECSSNSLIRLFYHFGFLKDETPKWLLPQLRQALNSKEAGLGDRIIK